MSGVPILNFRVVNRFMTKKIYKKNFPPRRKLNLIIVINGFMGQPALLRSASDFSITILTKKTKTTNQPK